MSGAGSVTGPRHGPGGVEPEAEVATPATSTSTSTSSATDARVRSAAPPTTGDATLLAARVRAREAEAVPSTPDDIYAAAKKVAAGDTSLLDRLDAAGKDRLAASLAESIARRNTGPGDKPSLEDLKARSGSATLALALLKKMPADAAAAKTLQRAYVRQLGAETTRGLKASMVLNIEEAKLPLDGTEKTHLAKAKDEVLPTKPPYEEWFKDGRRDLKVRHYVHPERWEIYTEGYEDMGFRKTVLGPGKWVYEKTFKDPNGRNPDMPVRIECFKTEKDTFRDMDDPGIQIELYSGHSNLGGNVLGALAEGPEMQHGSKWVINWMCRGKQVLHEVYNRYPEAHYMTTDVAVQAHEGPEAMRGIFEGIARRGTYRSMDEDIRLWASGRGSLMFPDDPRILEVRDEDRDGAVTRAPGSGATDPLYNVGLAAGGPDGPTDLKPATAAASPDPAAIKGDKVLRGINFLNTVLLYHHDHAGSDGRTRIGDADKIVADGWFDGAATADVCRVVEKQVGGKTYYHVQVNNRYAGQDQDAIGVAIAYEVNRHLSRKHNRGEYTEQDKLRGALLAGEYAAYLVDTREECDDLMKAMGAKYGFPAGRLTWTAMEAAMEKDSDGYATTKQTAELKRRLGGRVDSSNG